MNSWERSDETSLPDKEAFYSCLNIGDITDVDHRHAKRVCKKLIKVLVIIMICMLKVIHYCLQMYLKILEANVLKYMNHILLIFYLHLELLTNFDMLLMVEKGIRDGICHAIQGMQNQIISL